MTYRPPDPVGVVRAVPHTRQQRERLLSRVHDELSLIGGYADLLLDLPAGDPRREEGRRIRSEVAALRQLIAETVFSRHPPVEDGLSAPARAVT